MKSKRFCNILSASNILFISTVVIASLKMNTFAQKPWKGNAVLGNGTLCLVYSDDSRITTESRTKGIQHFYYKDFTTDYIQGSFFELMDESLTSVKKARERNNPEIGIENSFCTFTKLLLPDGLTKTVKCFVHPNDAAVLSLSAAGGNGPKAYKFQLFFRKNIITDRKTSLTLLKKERNSAVAQWSNNTVIIISPKSTGDIVEIEDSVVTIYGRTNQKASTDIIITASVNKDTAFSKMVSLKQEQNLYSSASTYWNKWLNRGILPRFKNISQTEASNYMDYYKRTLYSVKAATLGGMIPADITGQFVTNNMPQLYPRDAMMCARVFILTGHLDEAKDVIQFWTRPEIPQKSKGEFYARYDAYAKAVDAGSGARYDEPEWDANGYLIQLVDEYYKQKKIWLCDKSFIYELADFLVSKISPNGLLYEGGIVEWTGFLPSTNMTCSAALKTASEIANSSGEKNRAQIYLEASVKIANSLRKTFDSKRNAFCDVRFHGIKAEGNQSITEPAKDTLYLWDTSLNFGVLWGFPNTPEISKTNNFIQKTNVKNGGGVQYFEAKDNAWLSGYGGDLFFFTTSAEAEYQSLYGDNSIAKKHIDWMINNSNSYGLMPERIFLNQTDCSPASPLSWCSAEFAAAVLQWSLK